MKTPEEIKKWMEYCFISAPCSKCKYDKRDFPECIRRMNADALALIRQLEEQAPKWISVEERLPEGECLAGCFAHGSYGYGEYIIGYVSPYSESERSGYYAENSFELLDDVTHWMPLPEPPKEGDK